MAQDFSSWPPQPHVFLFLNIQTETTGRTILADSGLGLPANESLFLTDGLLLGTMTTGIPRKTKEHFGIH